eukprot:452602_1
MSDYLITYEQLISIGFTKHYIDRALKVYERNYGKRFNYSMEVIIEIISRLQKKDKNKAKQKKFHTSKITIEKHTWSQIHGNKSKKSKITQLNANHNNGLNEEESKDIYSNVSNKPNNESKNNDYGYSKGDIVLYKQYKAEIIKISDKDDAVKISYPLRGYQQKQIWVHIMDDIKLIDDNNNKLNTNRENIRYHHNYVYKNIGN